MAGFTRACEVMMREMGMGEKFLTSMPSTCQGLIMKGTGKKTERRESFLSGLKVVARGKLIFWPTKNMVRYEIQTDLTD